MHVSSRASQLASLRKFGLVLTAQISFRHISIPGHFKEHRPAHSAELYFTWHVSKFDNRDADFERDPQSQPMGAVVAVRVTSEDADDGFKPTCGVIDELNFRNSPDVWGYFSVKSGGGIHEFSDSQVSFQKIRTFTVLYCYRIYFLYIKNEKRDFYPVPAYLAVMMCYNVLYLLQSLLRFSSVLCSMFIHLLLLLVVDKAVHMLVPPKLCCAVSMLHSPW